jgi:hypothetical protein
MTANTTTSARTQSSVWLLNLLMKVMKNTNNLFRNSAFKSAVITQIVQPTFVNRLILFLVSHGLDTVLILDYYNIVPMKYMLRIVNAQIAPQELLMSMANAPCPAEICGRIQINARPTKSAVTTTAVQGPAKVMTTVVATLVTCLSESAPKFNKD